MNPDLAAPHDATGLRGRRVLVTGATGFLGRHLVRRLLHLEAEIHALTRGDGPHDPALPGVIWHRGDITDPDELGRVVHDVAPAAVFHLASQVAGARESDLAIPMLEANTRAAVAVMTAAHELGDCRVVLAGSLEEPHGDEPPSSPYAAAKSAATGYARLFHAQWDLPVTVLRIAMVYGPDQPDDGKLVPYVSRCVLDGVTPELSSGTRLVDWVYVDDVVDALVRAATSERAGHVLDIGSGRTASIADVVTELADLAGYGGPLGFGDRGDRRDDHTLVADPGPAAEQLGWRATTPRRDGLARTLAWHANPPNVPLARRGVDHAPV
ncbi:NAD-dependent dehydratase [Actinomycetospora sp. NBRC 106375]|uniref:NAD-dependent epimerase/dehydratase family protein n=1 Tax=Actinomycetospora sp. NBRC 106375 TaxID=3032207 RepID=UPI0024A35C9B|nr:NAD(P)-dependent oxidoreductase [Actinomycetospora sp. NBRC 106375]GLZ47753.1 NAD-dependent dehydratase [Actinomycetospora sp. NBRC 106375]